MKKSFYSLFAFAAILCACQANDPLEVNSTSAKKMTLTASLPSSETKVVYEEAMTDAGLSLKATWADNDIISVVSYDSDGKLISVDDFVCEGAAGKTTATFTGVLSDDDPAYAIAVYPRLTYNDAYECYTNEAETVFASNEVLTLYCQDAMSEKPSEMERLAQATVALGEVKSVDGDNSLAVDLQQQFSLIKVNMQMPEGYEGKHVLDYEISLYTYSEAEEEYVESEINSCAAYCPDGETHYLPYDWQLPETTVLHFGMGDEICSHAIDENGVLSAYIMVFPTQLHEGDIFYISVELEKEDGERFGPMAESQAGPISHDVMLEAGKVYTINCEGFLW